MFLVHFRALICYNTMLNESNVGLENVISGDKIKLEFEKFEELLLSLEYLLLTESIVRDFFRDDS